MRRTLTAAALLGVFIVAPAGSAFAAPPAVKPGNSYGNCGVNAAFAATGTLAYSTEGGYGGVSELGKADKCYVTVTETPGGDVNGLPM